MSQTVAPGRPDLDGVPRQSRTHCQDCCKARGMNRLLTRGKAYGQFGASDAENGKHRF